ncbi:hypothetical protein [Ruminococcus sp. 210702-SL.1.03]|jgi:hypothetical protein|uniref:hypothetical protein n=1 Tax=Ruminococcus sp. 210702-SL.1.03 TaxID=2883233 RepID=UPI001D06611B|nr:hypothetical protein [Ruminococcus sp. 210702-SL.1.03]MCB6616918.1 hypothetical protein [Ruminococcus sp. 210702-SL.1.03]
MPTLYLRDIPQKHIDRLDEIAAAEKMSRNQLCAEIIEKYISSKDDFVQQILPEIVGSYIRTELKSFETDIKRALDLILICSLRLSKTNEKLNEFLFPELEDLSIGSLKAEEIIAILNSEKDISDEEMEKIIRQI